MPKGAALSEQSSGESISHFTAIRIRINGTGNLRLAVYSLDDVESQTLVPIVLATATKIIPTRLCNFTQHRAAFELKTTAINEKFRVNRIIIFSKELWTSWPG
jgi:hypothetical protein